MVVGEQISLSQRKEDTSCFSVKKHVEDALNIVFFPQNCVIFFSPAETIEEIILTEAGKLRKDQSDEEWLWLNGSACGCDKN